MSEKPVVVIGAGIAGLTAALQLVRTGRECVVVESAARIGGCCATLTDAGRTWEPAASVVIGKGLLTSVLDPLDVDVRPALVPVRPIVTIRRAGQTFELVGPLDDFLSSVGARATSARNDRAGAQRFVDRWTAVAGQMLPTLRQLKAGATPAALARCLPFLPWITRSYRSVVREHFASPRLRCLLEAFSTYYAGLPAEKSPAILATLPALAIAEGCFTVTGGIQRLPELVAQEVLAAGGTISTATPALRIIVEGDRVSGVKTSSGVIQASGVIAACDIRRTLTLLPHLTRLTATRLRVQALAPSISVLSVLGSAEAASELPPITWVMGPESSGRNQDQSRRNPGGLLPLAAVTSTCGSGGAGVRIGGGTRIVSHTTAEAEASAEYLLGLVAESGLTLSLRETEVWRPTDYETALGLPGGNAFGFAPAGGQLGPFRYGPRTPLRNLMVAGQSCFPGFGIPLASFSGQLAATVLRPS